MAFLDDNGRREMKNEVGLLAAEIAVDGVVRLRLRRADIEYMQKLPARVAEAEARADTEGLRRLAESSRMLQVCARRAAVEAGTRLPACGEYARISLIAERLMSGGDRALDAAAMQYALKEFDSIQSLTMAEFWAFPEAVRIAVCEICSGIARKMLAAAEEYEAARKWMENGADGDIGRRPPAFFECALQLAMDAERPDMRLRLENALSRRDTDTEACVRLAQESAALLNVRLDNLLATVRAVESADWISIFEGSSCTEAELRKDPDGTYPRMSAGSRDAVRKRLAAIAHRLGIGELTIARYAVNAAQEMPAGDVRRGICWWIYDDAGSRELGRRLGVNKSLPRIFADPKGYGYMVLQLMLSLLLGIGAACICGRGVWLLLTFPLSWSVSAYAISRTITGIMKPRAVLRMEYARLPDEARTLVAIPALLTTPERARSMCRQLETLGCLDKDENIEYVLLGDYSDAATRICDTDMAVLSAARDEIARMNSEAGRRKYHYLHRERSFVEKDGIYRGSERKRGALMALCRLATGRSRGEFSAEGDSEEFIFGRFRYVVTLDADTRMLPGTAAKLVGTIMHPLNRARYEGLSRRGFALMQPMVELDAEECTNRFVKLFAGAGGLNTYSGMVSDMFHDLTGTGAYCGKAVMDMPAFLDSLEGKLEDGRILSHDFIEGVLCGAGHVNDISLFDGFPGDYKRWLSRLSRWTRGDWQLVPDIFSSDIGLLGRFRMTSNLLDSLREIALLGLFVISMWAGNAPAFATAIGFALVMPAVMWLAGDRQAFVRGSFELAILPATAFARADAISRALWRTFVSGRKLLEWVTSADAAGDAAYVKVSCRAAAILLLPGLFSSYWIAPALALGALFIIAPSLADDLAAAYIRQPEMLTGEMRSVLTGLARDTWRFFERYVDASGHYLPPDNVQLEPGPVIARRTSPTNIGMYLMSCVSARELGFIGDEELQMRLSDTLDTLERMEKWHGHVYNWYDIDSLEILRPRYVSAVDSGNLAAALLLCEITCGDAELAKRLRALAEGCDFAELYDHERKLFHIGADVERGRLSNSYYDLLASEARILSYTAIMLGQVPIEHWRHLGRPVSGDTLMSWSGTMFEYFMPALIMPSAPESLMGSSYRGVVKAQMAYAAARSRPWGVSESGYHAFDADMNYQYRAFGLRTLSMSGTRAQDVVAPYGACLGLMEAPAEAYENIRTMLDNGWAGECGLYEAIDFVRREPRVVKSWMAHHQGMALCAVCNALTGGRLQEYFMERPAARGLRLLLNEHSVSRIKLRPVDDEVSRRNEYRRHEGLRRGRAATTLADTALLGGAEAYVLVSARGDIIYSRGGVYASRFSGDILRRRDTMFTEFLDADGNRYRMNSASSASAFGAGQAIFSRRISDIDVSMRVAVSPEDSALIKLISMENLGVKEVGFSVIDGFETALMNMGELRSHPAFHRMFCRTEFVNDNAIVTRRRMREKKAAGLALVHAASCVAARETDWMRLIGREARLNADFAGCEGPQIDPCSALKVDIILRPGEKRELAFVVCLCCEGEAAVIAEKYSGIAAVGRALQLAESFVRSAAGFAGLDDEKRVISERACVLLADPRLGAVPQAAAGTAAGNDHADIPGMCITVDRNSGLDVFRDAIRMHEYCRMLGFVYQLRLIYDHGNEYSQPVRDGIQELIGASHLRDMCFARGGVTVYDAASLTEERRVAIERNACIRLDSGSGYWAQLRRRLMKLQHSGEEACKALPCIAPIKHEGGMKYGGFTDDSYGINLSPGSVPPAPWSNILAADKLGMLITERGGGFIWHDNSRLRRITAFDNDPAHEGWSTMFYVSDRHGGFVRALPGEGAECSYDIMHCLSESRFNCRTDEFSVETTVFADKENDELIFSLEIFNTGDNRREFRVTGYVDWLVGADGGDAAATRSWNQDGVLLASGTLDVTAYMACDAANTGCGPERNHFLGHGGVMCPDGLGKRGDGGCALAGIVEVDPGCCGRVTFTIGCGDGPGDAIRRAMAAKRRDAMQLRQAARRRWERLNDRFGIVTGDEALDRLVNGFMLKQVLDGRIHARAGFYQAGGAYGFRDQLQDMLAVLPYEPEMVRGHILECARHQFQDGDVMHWWHPPMTGVRTRISDDMLFLVLVVCRYIETTGEAGLLECRIPYLKNIDMPEGCEDVYAEMSVSAEEGTLHDHCMRALRRACRKGEHGLLLMGTGDWNDGMNRVGDRGRGESVWLTMCFCVCARMYAGMISAGMDRAWLTAAADELMENIQKHGWDGRWYLRAYDDDGERLGGSGCVECAIDLIAQAWSAFAGCPDDKVDQAMDEAWNRLYLPDERLLKLLTPPFTGTILDPGYIAAYPPGVRENGGQYTHAACWYLIALAKRGDAARVKELLGALLPANHALTTEDADIYRTEPYVMAADIYGEDPFTGRGGWTWYTGAAGWYLCAVRYILGYERRENRVRLNSLEGVWERPQVTIRYRNTRYTLICDAAVTETMQDGVCTEEDYIEMSDDGREHVCLFPVRRITMDNNSKI